MIKKYNAFISYRHSEKDSAIASEIQTRLERFKIPRDIQKKTGIKRFERIFRDKEELPITSDLNENIEKALEESDHLIVICSERTSESIWVRKEIETFLKYHRKKNIFTVLVDGDPGKVIPDILLHDTVTRKLADGREETREELIEPLSCDYRIGIKKARKVELPRLAASMLGCSYDELIQRRRQYVRRRNAMIISCASVVLAGIIAYLCWSLVQIRSNYDLAQKNYKLAQQNYDTAQINLMESMCNQSRYLAAESAVLLNNDDRVGATQLALAALPSEDDPRPLTTQAVYALHNALGTYSVPGFSDIAPVWKYSTGKRIGKFIVSPDEKKLAMLDEYGSVNVWDLSDHLLLKSIDSSSVFVNDIVFTPDSCLVISGYDEIVAFKQDLSEAKWSIEIVGDYDYGDILKTFEDTGEIVYAGYDEIRIIDAESGREKERHVMEDELEDAELVGSVLRAELDPTGRYLEAEFLNFGDYSVLIYDREEKTWLRVADSLGYISNRCFSQDGIVISYVEDAFSGSSSYGSVQTLKENDCIIAKYSVTDGELLWKCEVPHTLVGYQSEICEVDFGAEDEQTKCIFSAFSNKCALIETESGNVISVKELPSEFIDAYLAGSGKSMVCILRDGQYLTISLTDASSAMAARSYFNEKVEDTALFSNDSSANAFLVQYTSENSLIEYWSGYYDRSLAGLEGMDAGVSVYDSIAAGGKVLLFGDNMKVYCYDTAGDRVIWSTLIDGSNYTGVSFIGSNNEYVYLENDNSDPDSDRYGPRLLKLGLRDGKLEYIKDLPDFSESGVCCVGDDVWFTLWGDLESEGGIGKVNMLSGEVSVTEVTGDIPDFILSASLFVSPDEKKTIMLEEYDDKPTAFLVDMGTGKSVKLDSLEPFYAVWKEDSSVFALCDEEGFEVYNEKGSLIFEARSGENNLLSVYLSDKYVISVDSYGYVSFYDYKGTLVGNCEITVMKGIYYEDVTFEFYEDELIINSDSIANVIDMGELKPEFTVSGYLAYDRESNRFIVKVYSPSEKSTSAGFFVRRDVDMLIEEGKEYLKEAQLSEEMKNRYGI